MAELDKDDTAIMLQMAMRRLQSENSIIVELQRQLDSVNYGQLKKERDRAKMWAYWLGVLCTILAFLLLA